MTMDTAGNVDVLVPGCGPAGGSAAIAAHDEGARVLVVEERREDGGNARFAGGFLWDVRGAEAVRHVETLFFGKSDRAVAEVYVRGLNDLLSWIAELGGEAVGAGPPPGSFPAVIPSWPHVPGSQPALRRGEARGDYRPLWARRGPPGGIRRRARIRRRGDEPSGQHAGYRSRGVVLACGGFEADEYFKDGSYSLRVRVSSQMAGVRRRGALR